MKIAVIQMKPKLGNINYNANEILNFYHKSNADILLFPEMCLTGYLPKDTLLSSKFIKQCHIKLQEITKIISEKVCKTDNQNDKIKRTELMREFKPWFEQSQGSRKAPKGEELYEAMNKKFGHLNKDGKWHGVKIIYPEGDDEEEDI